MSQPSPKQLIRHQYWTKIINEWHKSALTQKIFCQSKNISYPSFQHWRHKLKPTIHQDGNAALNFVPIRVIDPVDSVMTLQHKHWEVHVPAHFQTDHLKQIMQVVMSL